jgi:hypothetical protein
MPVLLHEFSLQTENQWMDDFCDRAPAKKYPVCATCESSIHVCIDIFCDSLLNLSSIVTFSNSIVRTSMLFLPLSFNFFLPYKIF